MSNPSPQEAGRLLREQATSLSARRAGKAEHLATQALRETSGSGLLKTFAALTHRLHAADRKGPQATALGARLRAQRDLVQREIFRRMCHCPPCPGRGNDGHGHTHCAECCFGTGVEADEDCPVHGRTSQ